MGQDPPKDADRKLLLHVDHIQMQGLDDPFDLKMIWCAQRIAIELFDLQPRQPQHVAFPMCVQ